jgi:hypothetical protein
MRCSRDHDRRLSLPHNAKPNIDGDAKDQCERMRQNRLKHCRDDRQRIQGIRSVKHQLIPYVFMHNAACDEILAENSREQHKGSHRLKIAAGFPPGICKNPNTYYEANHNGNKAKLPPCQNYSCSPLNSGACAKIA